MKKSILFFMLFICYEGFSQITLDFQSQMTTLTIIRLNSSEAKFYDEDWLKIDSTGQFSLYNLDGSFYKTIQMPLRPDPSAIIDYFGYISSSLFDNDPFTIEYLIFYYWTNGGVGHGQLNVFREDGTVLLNETDASPYVPCPIFNTEEGTKLLLLYFDSNLNYNQEKVFNLPGILTTDIPEKFNSKNNNLSLYPNPNQGSFYVKINSENYNSNTIDLFSSNGKLINSYKSNNKLIHISEAGLPEGLYLLNNRRALGNSATKLIIEK